MALLKWGVGRLYSFFNNTVTLVFTLLLKMG